MTHYTDIGDPSWVGVGDIQHDRRHSTQILKIIEVFQDIGFVAGGAARYMMVDGAPEPQDIDVFMYHRLNRTDPLENLNYSFDGASESIYRFSHSKHLLKVQVVVPSETVPGSRGMSYGPPVGVLSTFTFTTEQAALWHGVGGPAGLLSTQGKDDTEHRVLRNNCISNPVLSLFRINKYGQKGYSISMESLLEIVSHLRDVSDDEYDTVVSHALANVS